VESGFFWVGVNTWSCYGATQTSLELTILLPPPLQVLELVYTTTPDWNLNLTLEVS
jgi:hypothetical protein